MESSRSPSDTSTTASELLTDNPNNTIAYKIIDYSAVLPVSPVIPMNSSSLFSSQSLWCNTNSTTTNTTLAHQNKSNSGVVSQLRITPDDVTHEYNNATTRRILLKANTKSNSIISTTTIPTVTTSSSVVIIQQSSVRQNLFLLLIQNGECLQSLHRLTYSYPLTFLYPMQSIWLLLV